MMSADNGAMVFGGFVTAVGLGALAIVVAMAYQAGRYGAQKEGWKELKSFQDEAIERGYGEYTGVFITTDRLGPVGFRWKPKP